MLATALDDGIPAGVLSAIEDGAQVVADASWLRRQQMLIGHTLIALQCGLWAAVTPLDLEAALRRVVEAGGDTDTNAAVAGAASAMVPKSTVRRLNLSESRPIANCAAAPPTAATSVMTPTALRSPPTSTTRGPARRIMAA